jgi:universal stress protein A
MSATFEKILCPVQFEQNSAAALRYAYALTRPDSRLYVLYVIPEVDSAVVEHYPSTLELARECLENFVREQPGGSAKVELLVRTGNPSEIIVNAARELAADIIVMATHGRRGIAHLVLGSVAERVVREATVPVLTIRPEIAVQPPSA